jgi:hypothetical protein
VSFAVAADAYDRFMGRYSVLLAPQLADFAEERGGHRVLDVGCGPRRMLSARGRLPLTPPAHAEPLGRLLT